MSSQEIYRKWMRREMERTGKRQVELGEAMGLDAVKMSKGLSGTRNFKPEELDKAAGLFGSAVPSRLKLNTFDFDEYQRDPTAGTEPPTRTEIPDGSIGELRDLPGLGPGEVIRSFETGTMQTQDAFKDEFWRFPQSFTRNVIKAHVSNMVALECKGDSMEPTIRARDRVWIDKTQDVISPEGLYAIRDPHGAIEIKRLQYTDDKPRRIAVISDNDLHPIRVRDVEDVPIVGRVVCVMKVF